MTNPDNMPKLREPIVVHLLGDEDGAELQVQLSYEPHDPYAVTMSFDADPVPISWTLDRGLLENGLCEPTGAGDVQVRPTLTAEGRAATIILLRSPYGEAELMADSFEIRCFLDASEGIVPQGAESDHVDVDGAIASILAAARLT